MVEEEKDKPPSHFLNPTLTLCQFCEICGPSICFTTQSVPLPPCCNEEDLYTDQLLPQSKEECCIIIPPEIPCFVTHEPKNHRTYVSTNIPALDQRDYTAVIDGLNRATNALCEASDIMMYCNSRNIRSTVIHSTVISKVFTLADVQARGGIRKAWLLMVLSDRFTSQQSIQFLQEHFTSIIKHLTHRARETETDQCNSRTAGHGPLRSLGKLLQFENLGQYFHQEFSKILNEMENKYSLLSVVPPGTIQSLQSSASATSPQPCLCRSSDTLDRTLRERAETLVDYTPPCFTKIYQISEQISDKDLRLLLQCVVQGHQVVVRGQHKATVNSILTIFTTFVPEQCVNFSNFGYRTKYDQMCRFTGLSLNCEVPSASTVLCLDVMSPLEKPFDISSFRFELRKLPRLNVLLEPQPLIVNELFSFIKLKISEEAYDAALDAVKMRWCTKATQYFLCKSDSCVSDVSDFEGKLFDILGVHSNDKEVLKYFKNNLKSEERKALLKEVQ